MSRPRRATCPGCWAPSPAPTGSKPASTGRSAAGPRAARSTTATRSPTATGVCWHCGAVWLAGFCRVAAPDLWPALDEAAADADGAPEFRRRVFDDLPAIAGTWLTQEENQWQQPSPPARGPLPRPLGAGGGWPERAPPGSPGSRAPTGRSGSPSGRAPPVVQRPPAVYRYLITLACARCPGLGDFGNRPGGSM